MGEPHLVYDFGVESLFKGLGPRLTPQLKAEVRALGIDLDRKLLPAYPKELWVKVVDHVAQALDGGDLSASRRELGRAISRGFADSVLGKIMAPGVRLMGVRPVLQRLPRSLTMSNNFLKVTVSEVEPSCMRVELSEAVPSQEFLEGVIEMMVGYAGGRSCTITASREGTATVLLVRWT
ncbi:MAG: DUF2378 family protein [Myxococcota bacterium]